eukprot:419507-Rhodomonas_salina.1
MLLLGSYKRILSCNCQRLARSGRRGNKVGMEELGREERRGEQEERRGERRADGGRDHVGGSGAGRLRRLA